MQYEEHVATKVNFSDGAKTPEVGSQKVVTVTTTKVVTQKRSGDSGEEQPEQPYEPPAEHETDVLNLQGEIPAPAEPEGTTCTYTVTVDPETGEKTETMIEETHHESKKVIETTRTIETHHHTEEEESPQPTDSPQKSPKPTEEHEDLVE